MVSWNHSYNKYALIYRIFILQVMRIELSLVPAEDALQNRYLIHPNLLSITIKEQNRIKFRGDLTSVKVWKLSLIIKDGFVFYEDHNTGVLTKIDTLINGNTIYLGKINRQIGHRGRNFRIEYPKQGYSLKIVTTSVFLFTILLTNLRPPFICLACLKETLIH